MPCRTRVCMADTGKEGEGNVHLHALIACTAKPIHQLPALDPGSLVSADTWHRIVNGPSNSPFRVSSGHVQQSNLHHPSPSSTQKLAQVNELRTQ